MKFFTYKETVTYFLTERELDRFGKEQYVSALNGDKSWRDLTDEERFAAWYDRQDISNEEAERPRSANPIGWLDIADEKEGAK